MLSQAQTNFNQKHAQFQARIEQNPKIYKWYM